MTEETLRLPPFPDELLVPEKREDAIRFLRGFELPSRVASRHLGRWAEYVGVVLERRDYAAVRRGLSPTAPEL